MIGRFSTQPRFNKRWKAEADDHVIDLAWSPDGKVLAAAAVSGPILLLDSSSGRPIRTLAGHGFGTTSVAWSRDGVLLASAGQDGKAKVWDANTGEERASLAGGAAWVEHVAWHPTADALVTAAGKKLRAWSPGGQLLREYPDQPNTIADLAWRPGTGELATASYGGVCLWSLDSAEPTARMEWKGSVLKLAWSPDGGRLAHGNQDATVHYWIVRGLQDLQMAGYPLKVREVCFDPSGVYLATGGGDLVTVWDTTPPGPEDTQPLSFKGHDGAISALEYQARGPILASGGEDGKLFLWQPGKFKKSLATADAGSAVSRLAWGPRDEMVAAGTESGGVVVYFVG